MVQPNTFYNNLLHNDYDKKKNQDHRFGSTKKNVTTNKLLFHIAHHALLFELEALTAPALTCFYFLNGILFALCETN